MNSLTGNGDFDGRPHPTQFEIVDKDGRTWGPYETAQGAAEIAQSMFPDQQQDPDCTGKGWNIQVAGTWCPFCKKAHPGGDTCMGHYP